MLLRPNSRLRQCGGRVGTGSRGGGVRDVPPEPAAGHTLLWRADFASTGTLNSGSPSNFSSVAGTGYTRKVGPRFGTVASDASWQRPGWSLRMPVAGAFDATYTLSPSLGLGDTIAVAFWFHAREVNSSYHDFVRLERGGDFAPVVGFSVKRVGTGTALTLAKTSLVAPSPTGDTTAGELGQWVFGMIAVKFTSASTPTFRVYYKLPGESSLTQLGTEQSGGVGIPARLRVRSTGTGTMGGALGGLSVYALTDLTDPYLVYPNDIVEPAEVVAGDAKATVYVSPNGSDTDSGFGSAANGLSYARLAEEVSRGTILGSYRRWSDAGNTRTLAADVTTKASGDALASAIIAGTTTARGMEVRFTGGTTAVPPGSASLNLESLPGVRVTVEAGSALSARLDLSSVTWTQPDAGTYPNVWKYAAANLFRASPAVGAVIEEDDYLLSSVPGANFAAVAATLNGTPRSCYADATGVYLHAAGSGDPNTDGLTRTCGVPFATSGTGPGLIALADGDLRVDGVLDVGPTYHYTGGNLTPQYCYSLVTGGVGVVRGSGVVRGGGKHTGGLVGNGLTGFGLRHGLTFDRGYLTNSASDWTTDVLYTSATASTGTIYGAWIDCQTTPGASFVFPGQRPTDYESATLLLTHSNGGRTLPAFAGFVMSGCTFPAGLVAPALVSSGGTTCSRSEIGSVSVGDTGTTFDRCLINTPRMQFTGGDVTFTNCIIRSKTGFGFGGTSSVRGTVVMDRCTLDVSNYTYTAGVIWSRAAAFSFTMTSGAIVSNTAAVGVSLVTGLDLAADTILFDHCAVLGKTDPILYAVTAGPASKTYTQAVADGNVTNSINSSAVGLDSGDDYAVEAGSPAIGVADAGTDVEDYTGTVFATRDDAGGREYAG